MFCLRRLGYMYIYIVLMLLSCFLGAVLYYSSEYANVKQYHAYEGPLDMGKLLKMNRDDASFYRK